MTFVTWLTGQPADGNEEGLHCRRFDALFDTLLSLAALVKVGYVVDENASLFPERPACMRLLLQLSRQPELEMGVVEWADMLHCCYSKAALDCSVLMSATSLVLPC